MALVTRAGNAASISESIHDTNLDNISGLNTVVSGTSDTIDADDLLRTVEYTSASSKTITLPLISTLIGTLDSGLTDFRTTLFNSGAGVCTINANASDSINGGTTSGKIILLQDQCVTIQSGSSATDWNVISKSGFGYVSGTFTSASLATAGKEDSGNIAHNLGTDDIDFGFSVDAGSVDGEWISTIMLNSNGAYKNFQMQSIAGGTQTPATPSSGNIAIGVKNENSGTATTAIIKWWARVR